jgi:uncharacterized membrane protein YfcA
VPGRGWTEVAALLAAYAIAVLATPAGISGAVLLLPFQASVLGTPSPAVTPTNLLYNVVATPGALYRYWRQGETGGTLALILIAGTLPGVIAGSIVRAELLPSPHRRSRVALGLFILRAMARADPPFCARGAGDRPEVLAALTPGRRDGRAVRPAVALALDARAPRRELD